MQDKNKLIKSWEKLLRRYRFVVMTDSSFEEKLVLTLSRIKILFFIAVFTISVCFVVLLLIVYTPLNEYVPGKSKKEVQENLIYLSLKSDSLQAIINNREVYLKNIFNLLSGEKLDVNLVADSINSLDLEKEITFKKSIEDSLLRVSVETEDKSSIYPEKVIRRDLLTFFPPVKGLVSDRFDIKNKHFGVDLVAKEKTRVSSVLDGTVIVSHWTAETGHVIIVQHKNNYLSQYKHNSVLLKKVGDFVLAGEHVAIIGNSGELSSGPHLHFELWNNGVPVNPEDYISF